MPPKARLRPAGHLRAGAKAAAKPKAVAKVRAAPKAAVKAKAKARLRRVVRKPAAQVRRAGAQGDQTVSEKFRAGQEVLGREVPLDQWQAGQKLVVTEGTYWEEPATLAGILRSFTSEGQGVRLRLEPEGTQTEGLVKWSGAHPGELLEIDLCAEDCSRQSKDGLVHCQRLRQRKAGETEEWMKNLLGMGEPIGEEDEMRKLRERAKELEERERKRKEKDQAGEEVESSSSESDKKKRKKEKKKKKKKKKKEKKEVKARPTKELVAVFGGTALDPEPGVRRSKRRRARRMAAKKSKKSSSSGSSSGATEDTRGSSPGEDGTLFGEEIKVKKVWRRFPGALTLGAVEHMQNSLLTQSGQPWNLDKIAVPPIYSQYHRMVLHGRMSAPMSREAQTLCYCVDLLLQGKIAMGCDTLTQRLKSLEQMASGSHFSVCQKQELVPLESARMTSPTEALEASRLQREESRAMASGARPWEKRDGWERRPEDGGRGKGKNKDPNQKGKSKGKNDGKGNQGQNQNKGDDKRS